MLSYRHAFHAGNHADVLKHIVWIEILSYLSKRIKRSMCMTHMLAQAHMLSTLI